MSDDLMSLVNDHILPGEVCKGDTKAQTILRNYECSSDDMM